MNSIHIIPGFAEGKLTTALMERTLEKSGFKVAGDPAKADIIFAHSGGCLLLPKSLSKLVVMVNIPYWPGKPLVPSVIISGWHKTSLSFRQSLRDHSLKRWSIIFLSNMIYMLNLKRNYAMWRGLKSKKLWDIKGNVVVIRNSEDTHSSSFSDLPFKHEVTCITLPGHHDDCWYNPQAYIDIFKKAWIENIG